MIISLLTFTLVSQADAKNKKPSGNGSTAAKTVKEKRVAALKFATKFVNSRKVTPANPNPAGFSKGIGLTTKIQFTRSYKDLYIQVRFLDKIKRVPATESWRENRYNRVNTLTSRANKEISIRAKQREATSTSEINEQREAEVAQAAQAYQESVKTARQTFTEKRAAIASFRKQRAAQIARWANKKKQAINKKMRASSGQSREKFIRMRQAVRAKRIAMHTKNALRYGIKMSAATANRQKSLGNASSTLSSRIQNIENEAAKMTDRDSLYISRMQTREGQMVANLKQRAIGRITGLPFPKAN